MFNGVGSGRHDKEDMCLEYNPFFDWYTCTCEFDKCLELEENNEHSGAGNTGAISGVVFMTSMFTMWAVKRIFSI